MTPWGTVDLSAVFHERARLGLRAASRCTVARTAGSPQGAPVSLVLLAAMGRSIRSMELEQKAAEMEEAAEQAAEMEEERILKLVSFRNWLSLPVSLTVIQ